MMRQLCWRGFKLISVALIINLAENGRLPRNKNLWGLMMHFAKDKESNMTKRSCYFCTLHSRPALRRKTASTGYVHQQNSQQHSKNGYANQIK
jgi:hypothetical protein